jgi:ferredoxin
VPIAEVKRLLMKEGQSTWGSEAELRRRYDMFFHQDRLEIAQWNPSAAGWAAAVPFVNPNTGVPSSAGPFAVPAQPAGFVGGQWMPTAGGPAVAAAPAPAPAPVAAAPAAPPAPAAPAANKGTFTVTLINPDGTQKFECPPNLSVLDAIDELGNAADFAGLPYACRAGSCSACTGKLVKGTMDLSGCGFLSAEQKAKGFVLTCAAKPTSDCTIETHKEEDLF